MANTYTQIYIQIVFAVEGRQNLIASEHNDELQKYITGIVSAQRHKLIAINNMPDHLHLLVGLRPDAALSELVRDIKANSSRFINEKHWVIASLVEDAVSFFHGERYDLRAWVVMPNHVHALFKVNATPMAEILESWKKYTAQKANRLLKRRGEFWQADYWDTYMRDSEHELETRKYIENNPAKAGLVLDPKMWPWSSARFRDEYGVIKL